MRARPLRGFMESKDYEELQGVKDLLYSEFNINRLVREVR